jgi:hypoxanthine phosphoribosyltransferase
MSMTTNTPTFSKIGQMARIESLWPAEEIRQQVEHLACEINEREGMRPEVVLPIMNAATIFAADLLRQLWPLTKPSVIPIRMQRHPHPTDPERFVATGPFNSIPNVALQGKRVLLVDTVYDSGVTIRAVRDWLTLKFPRSIEVCCLVWKNLPHGWGRPDYYAYDMSGNDRYLIGYGLDDDERHRGMPYIGYLAHL